MKRPWQFGLLAMALTGVSTYNVLFFKNYSSQQPAAIRESLVLTMLGSAEWYLFRVKAVKSFHPAQVGL